MVDFTKDKEAKEKAVALSYDMLKDMAPKLVAKGEGEIAKQIIKIAEEHGIEVRTNKDLVEVISAIEIDDFIPIEAYTAVAEIMRYIYNKNES